MITKKLIVSLALAASLAAPVFALALDAMSTVPSNFNALCIKNLA